MYLQDEALVRLLVSGSFKPEFELDYFVSSQVKLKQHCTASWP
jgi:hypothetical protein